MDRLGLQRASWERLEYPKLLELVARYASSRPGREFVAQLEPSGDRDGIDRAQAEVAEVRELRKDRIGFRLDALPDVRGFLRTSGDALAKVLSGGELSSIGFVVERSNALGKLLASRTDLPTLADRGRSMPDLTSLGERIERIVDPSGEILSTASPALSAVRDEIERLDQELRRWMESRSKSSDLKKVLQDSIVTVRNGRFVFAVRAEQRGRMRGVIQGESSSGATLFIEPQEIVKKGDDLSSARQKESREIARVLAEATVAVHEHRHAIVGAYDHLVELDAAWAKARFGDAFRAVRPVLSEGRDLTLRQARHPLLEWLAHDEDDGIDEIRAVEGSEVVPLDLALSASVFQLVVTGPNTGGKTVALKTVGLFALMAYSGIPVPAEEGASVPLFDGIYADIGDEQSLEQSLSTFSSHMTVISEILHAAGSKSLVLIDELGAGTDPLEGAALAEAILERLYRRGSCSLVTTHLGRLKEFAYRHRKCENASMEFDPEKLRPTYRLVTGLPGKSNALIIGRRIGVPDDVVDRAEEILSGEERLDHDLLDGMERTRKELERREREMRRHQKNAEELEQTKSDEVEALRSLRRGVEHELERVEEDRVDRLIRELEQAVRALGAPPKERREAYDQLLAKLDDARSASRLAERRRERALELKKGDPVFVPRLRSVCEIRKVNRTREVFTVDYQGIPTEVHYQDISWVLPPPGYEFDWYDETKA